MKKVPGILPSPHWLIHSGYNGLYQAMKRSPKHFAHIKQANKKGKSPRDWVRTAEKLEEEHRTLPANVWLNKHGYSGLVRAMLHHPELFVHIKHDKKQRPAKEWVPIAERLEKRFGQLPNCNWLIQNGYSGLDQAIRLHPELFAHIKQDSKKGRSAKEWVPIAERVEKKHGILPHKAWLSKHGYSGLPEAITNHPELFAHIKQDSKKGRSAREWVPVAEQLEEQYGVLPIQNWLIQNDFIGLNIARKKHPQLFAHIKQNKAGRSAKEWVAIARRLEKKHGILPIPSWLCKNGYSGLYAAMRQHPKLFARIKRNNRTERAAKKWITLAERLERKHGILPLHFWLQRNGYEGLSAFMSRHPKLFAHIRQDSRKRRSPQEWVPIAKKLKKKHGRIPTQSWLIQNSYSGLIGAMKKRPELFSHLKRK